MSSNKSSQSKEVVGRLRSQRALIRAPERKKFVRCTGCSLSLIRAPNHNKFVDRLGSQRALMRASDRKMFLIDQGVDDLR